jgi:hypothetical protein
MEDSDASSARLTSVIQRLASARTRQDREAIVDELHRKLEEAEDKLVADADGELRGLAAQLLCSPFLFPPLLFPSLLSYIILSSVCVSAC